MKRIRIDLEQVADYANLASAAHKAALGKRQRPAVKAFFQHLDHNLNRLSRDILAQRAPDGQFRRFRIFDPKERIIHAACFRDRVLHHAVMNLAGPVLDRALVASSFACRPGKGIHRAVDDVQSKLRRYPWYLKFDIAHYFDSIDHKLLLRLLSRRFKGHGFIRMIERILASYQTAPGRGLPIGSLTSQHFANYYLDGLDRHALETLGALAHVRYMDDSVLWCADKPSAKRLLSAVDDFALQERGLGIKPASVQINRSRRGITFCGFRILPGTIRLGTRRKRRYRALRRKWESMYAAGWIDAGQLQQGYAAVHAMTLNADSRHWRRINLQRFAPLDA